MTERAERFLEDYVDGYAVQDYGAAADALVAAGLLPSDRADHWKALQARLTAHRNWPRGPYNEETEAKAIELLEALFVPVRPHASDDWDGAIYMRYQEALSTLTAIQALSYERARPWYGRQQETLSPPHEQPGPQPEPEIAFTAGELSAVLTGPVARLDGMRVTCLELYGDCVILRFHQLLPAEPEDPVERREYLKTPFGLEDDVGTPYAAARIPSPRGCKPSELTEWPDVLVGWQAFIPGAPLDARHFSITWRDQRFEISLL